MADILDEILNDAKDEKKLILFRKSLPIIIILTIIIAISIAAYTWYANKKIEHNRKIGDMFVEIISGEYGDNSTVMSALKELVNTSENRQAELADLEIASKLIVENNFTDARNALEAIINNTEYYELTTSFARVLWIGLVLDEDKMSDAMQMQSRNYLQYFKQDDQPFFAIATLMKALFYKKNNQNDLAAEYANTVLNLQDATLILKEQARAILASI
ncbi:MAG: tetratricopeptide repeat protein [Rickettsiaceae bacterium]|nr:tetratricopeptide repeat protein [Rickettsiaceae bacterium]MDP4832233.1 tetratricopeptide repeat protein [Rickettsiaceae bacterium]MDP5020979.1 tetratricopeptide repeat protein [Rickettsiaceae bacterium]MDP5083257.1 tetratricopeptide repeat protein [Rickettsiaceae bacterium]